MTNGECPLPMGWKLFESTLGRLQLPSKWIVEERTTLVAATAPRLGWSTYFLENAVASVVKSAGSIMQDSGEAIYETMNMKPWSHVISVEPWEQGLFQRRMQFVYEIDGRSVAVSKFTASRAGKRIDLTCSAGFDSYYDLVGMFDDIARFSSLEKVAHGHFAG